MDLYHYALNMDPDSPGQLILFEPEEPPLKVIEKPWMVDCRYRLIDDLQDLADIWRAIPSGTRVAFDTETTGLNTGKDKVVGLSFCYQKGEAFYVALRHRRGKEHNLNPEDVWPLFQEMADRCLIIMHNSPFDMEIVFQESGYTIPNHEDLMLLARNADSENKVGLKVITKRYLGIDMIEITELFPETKGAKVIIFDIVHPLEAVPYACADADMTYRLSDHLNFVREQMPFVWRLDNRVNDVIRDVVRTRFRLDVPYFRRLSDKVETELREVEQRIWEAAGERFVVGSNKELPRILYEKLKLPVVARTPTGNPQTDDNVLETLKEHHRVIPMIQEYRGLQKLLGTYVTPLFKNLNEYGEGKFVLRNGSTPTGRLAGGGKNEGGKDDGSVGVNIHALPNCNGSMFFRAKKVRNPETVKHAMVGPADHRKPPAELFRGDKKKLEKVKTLPFWSEGLTEWVGATYCMTSSCAGCAHPCDYDWTMIDMAPEANIRIGFIAREGWSIVAIDWAAVELRIAANLSGESVWIDAFNSGADLHMEMTKKVLGIAEPTKEQRGNIKSLNFGLLYGAGPHNVAQQLNIHIDDAKDLYDDYWRAAPQLGKWKNNSIASARKLGYATTYFGRRRHLNTKPGELYNIVGLDPNNRDDEWKIRKQMGEGDRQALNFLVQGPAADLMRIAMVTIQKFITDQKWHDRARILTSVHDELVFEVRNDCLEEVVPVLSAKMCIDVKSWPVKLETDVEVADSWGAVYNYDKWRADNGHLLVPQQPTMITLPVPAGITAEQAEQVKQRLSRHPGPHHVQLATAGGPALALPNLVGKSILHDWPFGIGSA
jgi:DNA polymerase I-like protein with 3'-5' exonuclease and polymerase domains